MNTTNAKNPDVSQPNESSAEFHPSYGMVQVSRFQGNNVQSFFGSSTRQFSGITLTIRRASRRYHDGSEWYTGEHELIEVLLTESQFIQMIASMGQGSGAPCTISDVNLEELKKIVVSGSSHPRVPACPACAKNSLRGRIENEFSHAMAEVSKAVSKLMGQAEALQGKPTINRADRAVFLNTAQDIRRKIDDYIPYIQSQFSAALDSTLSNVKADLQGYVEALVHDAGIEALRPSIDQAVPNLDEMGASNPELGPSAGQVITTKG